MLVRRTPIYVEPQRGDIGKESLSLSDGAGLLPDEYSSLLNKQIIKPVEENLDTYFVKLKELGRQDQIKIGLDVVRENKRKITKAIESLKAMEAQEGIASIGLVGFDAIIKLNLEGIQVNISSGDNKLIFYDIIRRYIMQYTETEWPPPIDKYEYFIRNSSSQQICCYYWPLYAYIRTLFQDGFRTHMNLSDLFSLESMQQYCKDIFDRPPSQPSQQGQLGQSTQGYNKRKRKKGESRGGYSDGGQQQMKPPMQQQQMKPSMQQQQMQQRPRIIQQFQPGERAIASFAKGCIPGKLTRVKQALERNNIIWKIQGKEYPITEWLALEQIVSNYVKSLSDEQLIINNQSPESFVMNIVAEDLKRDVPQHLTYLKNHEEKEYVYKNYEGRVNLNETVVIDPIMQVPYTYGNLINWFGYATGKKHQQQQQQNPQRGGKKSGKKQKKGEGQRQYRNPVSVIKHALQQFRLRYKLPSPMFMLDGKTLEGVRRRLLKLLLVIFLQLEQTYLDVLEKVSSVNNTPENREELIQRLKNLMVNLNNAIAQETDQEKREKLIRLKDIAKNKFGMLVHEPGLSHIA